MVRVLGCISVGLLWELRLTPQLCVREFPWCGVWDVLHGAVAPSPGSGWFADIFPRITVCISQHRAVLVLLPSMLIG